MEKYDVLMAGVGGQGTILASSVLAEAAILEGYDAKKADVLGMAQRGGSVVSHIRLGPRVFSPLIKKGEADILIAFEKLEAARWSSYLKPGGLALVNDHAILPLSVSCGAEAYPSDDQVKTVLAGRAGTIYWIEGLALAETLGNVRTLSVVMVGALSAFLPMKEETWLRALEQRVPPKLYDLNRKAFAAGRERAGSLKPVGALR